ncbi:uncharacterized protein LOC110986400 [Acanthaster planci]|uniref:Uncharacterized protein LOC110986400 n=1 Tax=Acanthaster planci TaxID=133434 RepID=A0A8B7ZE64_ACAPL|nr:uncharacterized protein LOC110986400 [Acanthaster planci]
MMATVEKRPTFSPSTSSAYLVTLTLLEMLLFSPTVLSDCDQPCSPSFPMANQCQSVAPDSHCGYIHETSTTPSAPTNLRFRDFSYTFGNKTTLGLNITWQLPENYTGLRGFFVHVMKTSYPVGSQHCKKVAFPELTTALQRPSEVSFSMDCLHNVNVDGKYDITVTSLDSGMSVKKSHHTQNCYERPEVEGCLVVRDCVKDGCRGGVPSSDDWIPPHPKAHAVYEDHMWKVRVEFYVYPGNFWLTYRVNLYVYSNHLGTFTPIFSHLVDSNGSSGPIFHEFWNVTPGKISSEGE